MKILIIGVIWDKSVPKGTDRKLLPEKSGCLDTIDIKVKGAIVTATFYSSHSYQCPLIMRKFSLMINDTICYNKCLVILDSINI